MASYHRTSSSSMLVISGPRQLADENLYDPNGFDVYSNTVHPSSQKTTTRLINPAKIPRRAIDLFAGLKLKGRSTTKRRRRSTAMTIVGKEKKSGNFSSELAKKKNLREIKISRPIRVAGGWEVGDLISSEKDHPGLRHSPGPSPPTPPTGGSSRPTTPLLPEPPSPRSMVTGPPSQRPLPSIPPSPTSPPSVHRSLVSNHSGPPSHNQFYAGTLPPTGPLPELPSIAPLNPTIPPLSSSASLMSSPSPLTPPSRSPREEQWPLRDDSLLENTPEAQTIWPCPEPARQPPTIPGSSSPSSIHPESRKELSKTALSLWPAQEPSRKPLNTTTYSLSSKDSRSEPRGGETCGGKEPRVGPFPWFTRSSSRQGPLGGEPLPSSSIYPEAETEPSESRTRPSHRRGPRGGNPPTPSPSPHQGPLGREPLTSSSIYPEAETEPSESRTRPSHRRGPRGGNPLTPSPSPPSQSLRQGPLGGETRMENPQRLTSQASRQGILGRETEIEPSQRLKSQVSQQGPLGREPRMEPSPWRVSPSPRPKPFGEEPSMETSPHPTRYPPRQAPLGREPRMESSPWLVRPSPRPRPLGGEPSMQTSQSLTSQFPRHGPLGGEPRMEQSLRPMNTSPPRPSPHQGPTVGEPRTEHGPSPIRPSNSRGPCGEDPTISSTPSHEPRTEPPQWLTGPTPRRKPRGGEHLASSSTYPRPGMEPAPLLPRSTPRSESSRVGVSSCVGESSRVGGPFRVGEPSCVGGSSRIGESPTPNPTGSEPDTVPFQPVTCPFPRQVPGSGPAPGPSHSRGLPAPLPDIVEARDESVLLKFPITYHLALACAEDKHTSEIAESEQQLEYLKMKTKLYEDFFLALEAGRSSSVLGRGRREPRGRPGSLGELKHRLESQLRVMKAEETRITKGSGWI